MVRVVHSVVVLATATFCFPAVTPVVYAQRPVATAEYATQPSDGFSNGVIPSRLPQVVNQPAAYHTQVCNTCNNPSSACACGGSLTAGGCGVRGTNLFWCNPYPELIEDPCGIDACETCDGASYPLLFASIEVVPLFRDQKDDPVFQTRAAGGPALLETGDFETEFDAGMRVTLGATLTDRYRIEGSYLGNYEWSDRVAITNHTQNIAGGIGNMFSPFSNFGVPIAFAGTDFNNFAAIEMTSSFSSAEINIRRRCCNRPKLWPYRTRHCCVANSFLVGLRYLEVDEQFGYLTRSQIPVNVVNQANVNTSNEMFGVQIGMLSQFSTRWDGWIDFEIKGGIYHNEASLRSSYDGPNRTGTADVSFVGTDSHDRTTFLGELSLSYNHQVTSNLSMRLGYNAFWLTGIALASENLNSDFGILTAGPAQIDHGGDAVYHGPNIGFTLAY